MAREVTLVDAADAQEVLVDLAHHLVGVLDLGGLEGLDPPRQRQLRADLVLGGEGEQGHGAAQPRHPAGGVAGLGEREETVIEAWQ